MNYLNYYATNIGSDGIEQVVKFSIPVADADAVWDYARDAMKAIYGHRTVTAYVPAVRAPKNYLVIACGQFNA